jgi:hypothetical protein
MDMNSKEKRALLLNSVLSGAETAEVRERLRTYYDCLPIAMVEAKLAEVTPIEPEKPHVVDARELRRREVVEDRMIKDKIAASRKHKVPDLKIVIDTTTNEDIMKGELYQMKFVHDVQEVAPHLLAVMVNITVDEARAKINKAADKVGYKGTLWINSML